MPSKTQTKQSNIARPVAILGGIGVGIVAFYLAFVGNKSDEFRMVEMTDSVHATLPMMAGVCIAYRVSRKICTCSIYTSLASNYFSDSRGESLRRED